MSGWTSREADAVRSVLVREQDAMDVGPAPWQRLRQRRAEDVVRRRRVVMLTVAGALVVAMAVSGVSALSGGSGTTRTVPAAPPAAPLLDAPTTGSLAGDAAYVAAVRERASRAGGFASGVRVLLATDVPGSRVALVAWPDDRGVQWFVGPAGAAAADLTESDGCDVTDVCFVKYGLGWSVSGEPGTVVPAGVVVAASPYATTVVRAGTDVSADGVVSPLQRPAREQWPGFYVAPLPSVAGRIDVSVRPRDGSAPVTTGIYTGSSLDHDAWWAAACAPRDAPKAVGNGIEDPVVRGDLVTLAARVTGVMPSPGDGSRVVLAQRSADRQVAVIALRAASGGWARAVVVRLASGSGSTLTAYAVQALAAAADPGADLVAWQEGGTVFVTGGPRGTAVQVSTTAGVSGPVPVTRPVTEVGAVGRAEVADLLDEGGTAVASAEVAGPWDEGTVLS